MIKITEILPNPTGQDGNNEWIEIKNVIQTDQTNEQSQSINLENYVLDDIEDGSKPYNMPATTLQPNQTIILHKAQTKINLNNSDDEVRLFSPKGELLDHMNYGKSKEGLSYSLISIRHGEGEKSTYIWTTPSPNKDNPPLYLFEGTIISQPEIKSDFSFQFQPEISETSTKSSITITFTEETLDFETAKLIFQPQTKTKLLTSKTSNSFFSLVDYKLDTSPSTSTNANTSESTARTESQPKTSTTNEQFPTFIIPLIISALILTIIALKLKKKKS